MGMITVVQKGRRQVVTDTFGRPFMEVPVAERRRCITGHHLRHVIEGIVRGITAKEIKHYYGGSGAATGEHLMLLPRLPQNWLFTVREQYTILGYTVHEICHQLYTDFKILEKILPGKDDPKFKPTQRQKHLKAFWNAIEDYRIEKICRTLYPGFPNYIDVTRDHSGRKFLERVANGEYSAKNLSNPFFLGAVAVTWHAAALNRYRTPAPALALEAINPRLRAWVESWSEDLAKVSIISDSLDLAERMVDDLYVQLENRANPDADASADSDPSLQQTEDPETNEAEKPEIPEDAGTDDQPSDANAQDEDGTDDQPSDADGAGDDSAEAEAEEEPSENPGTTGANVSPETDGDTTDDTSNAEDSSDQDGGEDASDEAAHTDDMTAESTPGNDENGSLQDSQADESAGNDEVSGNDEAASDDDANPQSGEDSNGQNEEPVDSAAGTQEEGEPSDAVDDIGCQDEDRPSNDGQPEMDSSPTSEGSGDQQDAANGPADDEEWDDQSEQEGVSDHDQGMTENDGSEQSTSNASSSGEEGSDQSAQAKPKPDIAPNKEGDDATGAPDAQQAQDGANSEVADDAGPSGEDQDGGEGNQGNGSQETSNDGDGAVDDGSNGNTGGRSSDGTFQPEEAEDLTDRELDFDDGEGDDQDQSSKPQRPSLDLDQGDDEDEPEASDLDIDDIRSMLGGVSDPEAEDATNVAPEDIGQEPGYDGETEKDRQIRRDAVNRHGAERYAAIRSTLGGPALRSAGIVRRLLQSRNTTRISRGREEGDLDFERVVGMALGDSSIYRQMTRKIQVNTAISLLLDNSGSMEGDPLRICQQTAIVLDQSVSGTKTAIEISGFTSEWPTGNARLYQYRTFEQKGAAAAASLGNMTEIETGGTPVAVPIYDAIRRLTPRPEERKIIIVVSDGEAQDPVEAADARAIAESMGYLVVGISIGTERHLKAMREWCRIAHGIANIEELPLALTRIVQEMLN